MVFLIILVAEKVSVSTVDVSFWMTLEWKKLIQILDGLKKTFEKI